jgi:hypothetical protein
LKRILNETYLPAGHFLDRVLARVGHFPVREEEDDHRDVIVEVAPLPGAHLQQLRVGHLVLLGCALERNLDEVPRNLLQITRKSRVHLFWKVIHLIYSFRLL